MPLRRPIVHSLCAGAVSALLLAACGGGGGPSFAGAIDTASTRLYSEDARALMMETFNGVYGHQDVSTPLPVAAAPTRRVVDPLALARGFVQRAARMGGVTAAAPSGVTAFLSQTPAAGPSLSAMTCVPQITGVDTAGYAIDTDDDGIPDDLKVDFGHACSDIGAGGLVITYGGSYRIQDTEVGWGTYVFTADKLSNKLVDGSTGDNIKDVVSGVEHADFSADLATHSYDVTFARIGTFDDKVLSVTFDLVENSSYDVDNTFSFTVGGLTAPPGTMTLTLDYQSVGKGIGGDNVHFAISTPTALHFQSACASLFNGGVLQGLLNGDTGTGFRITWNAGCTPFVLTMFGTTDGP